MKFLAQKVSDGNGKQHVARYCRWLGISRQGFYKFMKSSNKPWKHAAIAQEIRDIIAEDDWNDNYGKKRIWEALLLKHPDGDIPSITTIYRILTKMGIIRKAKKKPNGITKADKNSRKSDDLLRRNFLAESPFTKCITDMTEVPVKGGKLYVSAIFDCFHLEVLGLAMDTNMRAELCIKTLQDAHNKHPELCGAIIHSDRGSQYTSNDYRAAMKRHGFIQSMNSDGGRCHDNARCESMWARMKEELLYGRYDTTKMTTTEVKSLIWRYYESYWNNRRICSAIGGMPPKVKLGRYYASLQDVA